MKTFKSQIEPRKCCNYPLRFILPEHQEKCKKSCDNVKGESGGCCILDCVYHKTGVVRDLKFGKEAFLELYENYLNEKGAGKFDQWMTVVSESIETCSNLGKKSHKFPGILENLKLSVPNEEKIFTCSIPQFALDVMDCVSHFNFLNCPNYVNSTECRNLKEFVKKPSRCGREINGSFIIDYKFFDSVE